MKILLSWLQEFTPVASDAGALAQQLSLGGLAVEGVSTVNGETILDLDITSNRPDCLSHYGVAREVAAITGSELQPLRASQPKIEETGAPAALAVRVSIEAPAACGRYCARVLEGVTVGASPGGVAARLNALGHRAINNIADLTNYALWEMGQPTHAFDLDLLRGGELRVRFARAGETLVTLDEVDRKLDPADLVIADRERPVALAGVMGGIETAIGAATRRVVIESAWFDPLTVRRTARRHGLHTDASHRFERGADPEAGPLAADRIAARARGYGATVLAGLIDVRGEMAGREPIPLRLGQITRLLGSEVGGLRVEEILLALGLQPQMGAWIPPSWRPDLTREVDLIEEVARIHGLERFPSRLPAFAGVARELPENHLRDRARRQMRARGFAEAVTISFAAESECAAFAPGVEPVRVLNPLSEEAAILRTSPLPAMLHLLGNNLNRGAEAPRLFEIGKTYRLEGGAPREEPVLCCGAVGGDFFALKAIVGGLLDIFELPALEALEYRADPPAYLHPGRGARVLANGKPVAVLGQLHPELASAWKLPAEVFVAEVALGALYAVGPRQVRYRPPSRFPASSRDFSFLFADGVGWAAISAALSAPPIAAVAEFVPAEVFRGAQVEAGHYSLLLRARFQLDDRTLREEEVQAGADEITARLRGLGGQQR